MIGTIDEKDLTGRTVEWSRIILFVVVLYVTMDEEHEEHEGDCVGQV